MKIVFFHLWDGNIINSMMHVEFCFTSGNFVLSFVRINVKFPVLKYDDTITEMLLKCNLYAPSFIFIIMPKFTLFKITLKLELI